MLSCSMAQRGSLIARQSIIKTGIAANTCVLRLFSVATISRARYISDADTIACYIGSRSSASVGWRTITVESQERGTLLRMPIHESTLTTAAYVSC
jgi:hypothetical protein